MPKPSFTEKRVVPESPAPRSSGSGIPFISNGSAGGSVASCWSATPGGVKVTRTSK